MAAHGKLKQLKQFSIENPGFSGFYPQMTSGVLIAMAEHILVSSSAYNQ